MAAESSPRQNSAGRVSAPGVRSAPVGSSGPSEVLLPGERVISELEPGGGGYFQLTHARVIYNGGGGTDSATAYASVRLKDISSIQISRRPRARRSAAWGVVGLFSAIGVWQVTPDSTIGIGAAVMVALTSLFLMADYWVRPAGVFLEFRARGGTIAGEVGGKASNALAFARQVEDEQRRLGPSRVSTPFRKYPAG